MNWTIQFQDQYKWFFSVYFPVNDVTGYAAGTASNAGYQMWGTILKTTDGGASFVEETAGVRGQGLGVRVTTRPNPFISFATVPGHEAERFALYDITGRRVGTYKGDRIGMGLRPGVYFIRALEREAGPRSEGRLGRIVKIR